MVIRKLVGNSLVIRTTPQGVHAFARSSCKQLEKRKQMLLMPVALSRLPTEIGADDGQPADRYRLAILVLHDDELVPRIGIWILALPQRNVFLA